MLLFKTYLFSIDPCQITITVVRAKPFEKQTPEQPLARHMWFSCCCSPILMISVSGKPVKKKKTVLCVKHNAFCVHRPVCWPNSLFPLLCSSLGEQDLLVCWLAGGDARCFSLDRSAAATILCNLSVFVSGQTRTKKRLSLVLDRACVRLSSLVRVREYLGLLRG